MLFDIYDQKQDRMEEQEAEAYYLNKNSQFSAQFSNLKQSWDPELSDRRDDHVQRRSKSVPPQKVYSVLSPLILPQRDL